MNNLLKYSLWGIGAIASLIILVLLGVWTTSSITLNKKYAPPETALVHSNDADTIEVGARLAKITGCTGCHKENMQGGVLVDLPDGSKFVAPNIPRIASNYSDADLSRAIKYGVRPDKTGVVAMPSEAFFALTDNDLTAILSYIRATPDQSDSNLPKSNYGVLVRFLLTIGEVKPTPMNIDDMTKPPVYNHDNAIEHGGYLARIACAECHGLDFKGQTWPDGTVIPDLMIATAYSFEEFNHLMDTGIGKNNRDLGLMSEVAAERFHAFTDQELEAMLTFFTDRTMNAQ